MVFYKELKWSPLFLSLVEFAKQYISDDASRAASEILNDGHNTLMDVPRAKFKVAAFLPIPVEAMLVLSSLPHSIGRIHKDGLDRKAALNIPILNTANSWVEWPEPEQYDKKPLVSVKKGYANIRRPEGEAGTERDMPRMLDRLEVLTPCLIDTDTWHRVNNQANDSFRYLMTIRFKDNPSFDELDQALRMWM